MLLFNITNSMGNIRNRISSPILDPQILLLENEPESEIIPTATLKPPIHIRKESLTLRLTESGDHMIKFFYDSYSDVSIYFYFFAIESVRDRGNTECYYIDLENTPPPVEHKLPGGLNLQLPDNLVSINLIKYSLAELTFADKKMYPLIIEIVNFI